MFTQTLDTSLSLNEQRGMNPSLELSCPQTEGDRAYAEYSAWESTWYETLGFEELTTLALILSISNIGMHRTLQKQRQMWEKQIVHTLESLPFQFHRTVE